MHIIAIALGLVERHQTLLGADPELVDAVADRYRREISSTAAEVADLFEQRADFGTEKARIAAANRLRNPRLRATYPNERRSALDKRVLEYGDMLKEHLPAVFEASLKLELAQAELAEEDRRVRDFADANDARQQLGLYVEVIEFVNALYSEYGVTRRHHPCLNDEQVRDIAAIILRRSPNNVPPTRHGSRGDVARG